mgnify:FL=1
MAWRPFVVEPLKAEVMPSEMQLRRELVGNREAPVSGPLPPVAAAETGEQHPVTNTAERPPGAVYIQKVEGGFGNIKAFLQHSGMPTSLKGREGLAVYKDALVALATEVCQTREPVVLELKQATSGKSYVTGIRRVPTPPTDAELDAEAERQALAEDAFDVF